MIWEESGSECTLLEGTISTFTWETEENHETPVNIAQGVKNMTHGSETALLSVFTVLFGERIIVTKNKISNKKDFYGNENFGGS